MTHLVSGELKIRPFINPSITRLYGTLPGHQRLQHEGEEDFQILIYHLHLIHLSYRQLHRTHRMTSGCITHRARLNIILCQPMMIHRSILIRRLQEALSLGPSRHRSRTLGRSELVGCSIRHRDTTAGILSVEALEVWRIWVDLLELSMG